MVNNSIVECANGTSASNETSKTNGSSKTNGTSKLNGTSELNRTSEIHKNKQPKNPFLDDDDEVDSYVSVPSQEEPPTSKAPVRSLPPLPPRKCLTNEPLKIPVRIIQKCVQTKRASFPEINATLTEPTESNDNVVNIETESCAIGNNCETGAYPKWADTYRENQEKLRDLSHFGNETIYYLSVQFSYFFEFLEPQQGMPELNLPLSIGDMIDICTRHYQSFDEVFVHINPTDKRFDNLYIDIAERQEQFKPMNNIPRMRSK